MPKPDAQWRQTKREDCTKQTTEEEKEERHDTDTRYRGTDTKRKLLLMTRTG